MTITADILEAMVEAGCTPAQLIAVVRANEVIDAEKEALKREQARIRKQRQRQRESEEKQRSRHTMSRVTDVTSRDTLFPLEGSSPEPLTPKTSISQSPSSLRSSGDAPAHMEFLTNFWPVYPHKVGKPDAERAFVKARRRAPLTAILAGLDAYVHKRDDRPWCNPSTWLNQDRWNDQPAIVPRQQGPPGFRNSDGILAALKRKLDEDDDSENGHDAGNHQDADYPLLGLAAKGHDRE